MSHFVHVGQVAILSMSTVASAQYIGRVLKLGEHRNQTTESTVLLKETDLYSYETTQHACMV